MRSVPRPPLDHICTGCSHIVPSWFLMCERVLVESPADGEQRGGVLQDRQRCGSEGPDVCHALQTGEDQGENSCRSVGTSVVSVHQSLLNHQIHVEELLVTAKKRGSNLIGCVQSHSLNPLLPL